MNNMGSSNFAQEYKISPLCSELEKQNMSPLKPKLNTRRHSIQTLDKLQSLEARNYLEKTYL